MLTHLRIAIFVTACVPADVSYRPERIFEVREIGDFCFAEDALRCFHGISADHTPYNHLFCMLGEPD